MHPSHDGYPAPTMLCSDPSDPCPLASRCAKSFSELGCEASADIMGGINCVVPAADQVLQPRPVVPPPRRRHRHRLLLGPLPEKHLSIRSEQWAEGKPPQCETSGKWGRSISVRSRVVCRRHAGLQEDFPVLWDGCCWPFAHPLPFDAGCLWLAACCCLGYPAKFAPVWPPLPPPLSPTLGPR